MGTVITNSDHGCLMHTIFIGSASILLALLYAGIYAGMSKFLTFLTSSDVMGFRMNQNKSTLVPSDDFSPNESLDSLGEEGKGVFVVEEEIGVTSEIRLDLPEVSVKPTARYSARSIWRNVYGLGGAMYMVVIVIQFSNDIAVLFLVWGFTANAIRELNRRCGSYEILYLSSQCVYFVGITYLLVAGDILVGRFYTLQDCIVSIVLPTITPIVLKSIRKPDNVSETLELAMPCTCLIALVMVLVSACNMHPCVTDEVMKWVTTPGVASDGETLYRMSFNVEVLVICLVLPITTLGSVVTIVGAVLQKRSVDIACIMAWIHTVHIYVVHLSTTKFTIVPYIVIASTTCCNLVLLQSYIAAMFKR